MTTTCVPSTAELILDEQANLRRLARRFVRCDADVDDLVQDTLLRAYRARDRFQPGTSVRAWTTTILRRAFLTRVVSAKRRRVHNDTDAGGLLEAAVARGSAPSGEASPSIETFGDHLDDEVKAAFDGVPELYRTAFFLSAIGGMSCKEIGHQLRVPFGTVMSRIHRARERLKGDLSRRPRSISSAPLSGRRTRTIAMSARTLASA